MGSPQDTFTALPEFLMFLTMLWAPTFVLLVTHISYGAFQPVLVQTPSQEVAVGGQTEIPCTLSTGKNFDIYRVIWLQQKNDVVRMVYHFRTGDTQGRGPGIPERFSVTDDVPNRRWHLVISRVQPEDDADYYCTAYFDQIYGYIFGTGTKLDINTGEVKAPSVIIYRPSDEELKTDMATTVCAINNFTPSTLSVEWTVDGTKWTSDIYSSLTSKQADNLYMKSSLLSMTTSEYNKHQKISCKVTHQGKDIVKTLDRSACS
ncbi:immunoglobulin lambda-1 light chain-like [Ranitomeya imitator]|uniref:immunoglobulin lambda-1 light chain-like n=1 Tax=Ranitomeya imitator TaxID=111125 RepID=UPI0037E7B0B4